jgi:hypothetical protein
MAKSLFRPLLSKSARNHLVNEMEPILHGTPQQRRRFLVLSEQEISFYWNVLAPLKQERDLAPDQLEAVFEIGEAFAKAIETLKDEIKNILRHRLRGLEGGGIHDFENVVDAANWARRVAKAAKRELEEQPKNPPGPPPGGDRAVIELVKGIAHHYQQIFKKQPSAAREGTFARALAQVLEACDVRDPRDETKLLEIGESRLGSILKHPTE